MPSERFLTNFILLVTFPTSNFHSLMIIFICLNILFQFYSCFQVPQTALPPMDSIMDSCKLPLKFHKIALNRLWSPTKDRHCCVTLTKRITGLVVYNKHAKDSCSGVSQSNLKAEIVIVSYIVSVILKDLYKITVYFKIILKIYRIRNFLVHAKRRIKQKRFYKRCRKKWTFYYFYRPHK